VKGEFVNTQTPKQETKTQNKTSKLPTYIAAAVICVLGGLAFVMLTVEPDAEKVVREISL